MRGAIMAAKEKIEVRTKKVHASWNESSDDYSQNAEVILNSSASEETKKEALAYAAQLQKNRDDKTHIRKSFIVAGGILIAVGACRLFLPEDTIARLISKAQGLIPNSDIIKKIDS